jgi:hypothetical protein
MTWVGGFTFGRLISMSRITAIVAVLVVGSLTVWGGATLFAQAQAGAGQAGQSPNRPNGSGRIRVAGELMLGMVEHKVMPVYPDEAMLKGIQGDAIFVIEIDNAGKVTATSRVEGDPLLVAASDEALRKTRFRPYLVDGEAVPVETRLGFHFSVKKNDGDGVSGQVDCIAPPMPPAGS